MGCWEVSVCVESVNRKPYMYTVFVGSCGFPSRIVEPLAQRAIEGYGSFSKLQKKYMIRVSQASH